MYHYPEFARFTRYLSLRIFATELTDNLIAAQAFVFFLAGFETSSTTLSFCLHELAVNKSVQDEVYNEIKLVVQKSGEHTLNYDSLKDLILLEQCLMGELKFGV